MEYGNLLDDALHYTKDGIFSNVDRWIKLIVAIICLGIPMNGYVMRIYRGTDAAPEVDRWGTLFVDGIKLIIVGLIYAIPVMILWVFIYGDMMLSLMQGDTAMMQYWSPNLGLLLVMYIIEIIIGIIMPVAAIRFARMGSFSEAFNFSAILATIKRIGWINYIIALILIALVIGIPVFIIVFAFVLLGGMSMVMLGGSIVALFGFIGAAFIILLVLMPLFGVFQARYITKVYESAGPEA